MKSYIMLAVFSIGAIWFLVDALKVWRKKNFAANDKDLAKEYKSLYIEHRLVMVVVFIVIILMNIEDIVKS